MDLSCARNYSGDTYMCLYVYFVTNPGPRSTLKDLPVDPMYPGRIPGRGGRHLLRPRSLRHEPVRGSKSGVKAHVLGGFCRAC